MKSAHCLVIPFTPKSYARTQVLGCVRMLMRIDYRSSDDLTRLRSEMLRRAAQAGKEAQTLRVIVSVLSDLRSQGWSFKTAGKTVVLQRYEPQSRDEIRAAHSVGREEQLRGSATREFVRSMERRRLGPEGWVSIFSLMRDGRSLAEALRGLLERKKGSLLEHFEQVVKPYVQVVSEGATCNLTGYRLMDIWRYFRHTWANEYATVPGRTMHILIRDAATANHPVIGIAALSSPVVHLSSRDSWLGWTSKAFIDRLTQHPSKAWAQWALSALEQVGEEIYIKDFLAEKLVGKRALLKPDESTIQRLNSAAEEARANHQRFPSASTHKNPVSSLDPAEWELRAKTYLFRWKRASTLAEVLETRQRLHQSGFTQPTKEGLLRGLSTPDGRRALDTIRRWTKARHIGNDVLDITVCGAVPPYNYLLGGKLVAMLLTGPEVRQAYASRYYARESIIASSMAGRPIRRKPQVVVLTTTSLYGGGLSQYTRISIPVVNANGDSENSVRYQRLGVTEGQGSFHFSRSTIDEMKVLMRQNSDGGQVNSIFGEGVSPRLRKIRTALEYCGFPSDYVLTHGSSRDMYGILLASNARDVLIGKEKRAKYLIPDDSGGASEISRHWMERWSAKRLTPEVLDQISAHSLVHPIQHGARVELPAIDSEEPLFGDVTANE